MIYVILIEYILLAYINYILLWRIDIKIQNKNNNEEIEFSKKEKKLLYIIMSILWIIYLPQLYFTSE